jgi:uncharacterized protein involved in exopolysaccharide biosynthesis
MARKGITFDQVANAAAAIQARGTEPTISAIRVELNNEGSFSTISQHLAKWREQTAERIDIKALPENVENAALSAITTIWNIATKEASADIAAIKEDHKAEKKRMQADIDALLETNKHLEETIEREVAASEKDRKQISEAEKKLTAVNSELETMRKMYSDLLAAVKQPGDHRAGKADDTKPARRAAPKREPENKPAGAQDQH